jgi:hypothetical protein
MNKQHDKMVEAARGEMLENLARSVAVRARPNHGGTGTCICVECENVKYGVRWGYREGFDAAREPFATALRALETTLQRSINNIDRSIASGESDMEVTPDDEGFCGRVRARNNGLYEARGYIVAALAQAKALLADTPLTGE